MTPGPTLTPGPLPVCSSCLPPFLALPAPPQPQPQFPSKQVLSWRQVVSQVLSLHSWEFAQTQVQTRVHVKVRTLSAHTGVETPAGRRPPSLTWDGPFGVRA